MSPTSKENNKLQMREKSCTLAVKSILYANLDLAFVVSLVVMRLQSWKEVKRICCSLKEESIIAFPHQVLELHDY